MIMEGSGTVQLGGETEHLSAGDAASAAAGVVHSFRNPEPDRLVVMTILTPPPQQ